MDWDQKIGLWLSGLLALIFILIGIGILVSIILPGSRIGLTKRIIIGGFILAYGLFRSAMILRKWRNSEAPKHVETGSPDNR